MKKIIYCSILLVILSCSTNDNKTAVPQVNARPTYELGLKANENIYPEWPNTWSAGLGDNEWLDRTENDTLTITRRFIVYDDGGSETYYTFLLKDGWIYPLSAKTRSNDQNANPPVTNLIWTAPIQNFRIQQYIPGKVLACEIVIQQKHYNTVFDVTDRIWVDLSN